MLSALPGCKADTNLFRWRWRSFGPFCLPRLCSDGEDVHLYHTTDNSRVYHKEELKSLEIPAQVNEESRNCCVRRCKWCCSSFWRNCFPFRTWMLSSSWSTPTPNLCLWEVYHAILLMTRSDTVMFKLSNSRHFVLFNLLGCHFFLFASVLSLSCCFLPPSQIGLAELLFEKGIVHTAEPL